MKRLLLLFGIVSCWSSLLAQKPNIAPGATITNTGTQTSPTTLNDLVYGTCGTQIFWMSSTSGSTTDYIEWSWPIAQSFDEIKFYQADATTARQLDGGVLQAWDGSAWVTAATFSNLPLACDNTITFQRITTTKLRLTQMIIGSGGGQTTNVNFREIEIFQASVSADDAGVTVVDSSQAVCPGSYPVNATIQNFGTNQIDSVQVNWSVDGVAQTSVWHSSLLDTIGGTGLSSASVALGNYTFAANTNYNLKVWTSMPNSAADTVNYNDTLSTVMRLGSPTGFMASNVQTTSADLSWNTLGASNFRVTYGAAGFNPLTGGNTNPVTGSSTTLSSLSANTLYEAYLVADCGGSAYSDTTGPISFRTPCTVAIAPFNENFDSTSSWFASGSNTNNTIDPCWSSLPDVSQGAEPFKWIPRGTGPTSGNGPLQDLTGGNFMYVEASSSTANDEAFLTTPPIDVSGLTTPGLYFFQHRYSNGNIADMDILVSDDFGTTWNNEYSISGDLQASSSDPWALEFVNLANYTGDTIMVQFKQTGNGCCGDAAIDSLVIDEAPLCPWPNSAGVVTTTDSSAVISWTDPSGSGWEVIWGPPGFSQASPGAGTRNTTNNPDTIPGLQSNTAYEYYVRTDCGPNGNSIWIGPIAFRTECSPFAAPYFTNYDNSTSTNVPFCWGNYINGAGSAFSQAYTQSTTNAYSAPNALYIYNYLGTSLAADTVIAISPNFSDITVGDKQLRFKAYTTTTAAATLIIGSMPNGSVGSSITPFDTITLSTAYQEFIIPISTANGYNGTDNYIGLMHGQSGIVQTIYVDDFNYEVTPPCPPPSSTSLGTSFVGSNSASLYWGSGAADSTKVEVGAIGFTPGTGTQIVAVGTIGDTVSISGLTPQTTYEFYIQDTCYGVGSSGWLGPFPFTTSCLPIAAPYLETFDGTSWVLGNGSGAQTGTVDQCWTRNPDANSTWTWNVYNGAPSSGSTGPGADYSGTGNFLYTDASYSNSTGNADIFSPLIDVSALTVPYVNFFYYRYGDLAEMGDMEVAVNDGSGWVTLLTLTGTDQTSTTDPWKESGADVSAFGDTIQVRFRGVYVACCQGDMAIDQFEVKEAPSCPNLVGLDTVQVTPTTATLAWLQSGSAANGYEVWYGPQGFYQGTATVGGTKILSPNDTLTLIGLSVQTCYEYVVRALCSVGDTSDWAGPVSFCTKISCPAPTNFAVTSTSGNTATLGWNASGGSQGYVLEYGQGNFTRGTGTVVSVTGTSYTITNLPQNNTAYQAYVRSDCGTGDSSVWVGPLLIVIDPNLCTEDFEVYNTGLIDGQSTFFIGWAGAPGDAEITTTRASSGTKSLHIYTTGPSAASDVVANMDSSFTSGIYSLKFNMFIPTSYGGYYNILHDYTGATNVWAIEVYIDANGTATVNGGTNSTAVIGTYNTTPNSWNTIEHIIDLDNDTAWVMVNGVNTSLGWQFSLGSTNMGDRFNAVNFYSAANPGQTPKYYVDDFCMKPYVPVSCASPTTLNVSSTNVGCDSAEVSWVSPSPSNNSILEYGPTGYTPGTGTLVPYVMSPYTITGLTQGTSYDFYVADTCANDTSDQAGPFTFSTTSVAAHASFTWSSTYTATTQDVTFDAAGSSNADTYTWDFGNSNIGTGVNVTESYGLPNGSFTVKLTVTNACGSTDDTTVVINTNIGLNDLAIGQHLKVYPNPNNGEFTVEVKLVSAQNNQLVITDMSGKEVYRKEIEDANGAYAETLSLKYLPKGVYMLNLETRDGKLVRRLVIE
ncbi:T9SS type A sorting domain-containing protein [Owenweeksia hongkongensis]|uniref:T9SS type A sorting domain-containing protein n=1 Tax=Owenweeksia hongkongensis TaxID=253245 RepID=UPI003A93E0D2